MGKRNNDGFTLIELLGIIVLLAILGLLVFKVIDSNLKNSKETAYEKQLSMIELSAKNYMSEHIDELPDVGGETYLTLGFMKIFGYSDLEVVNPKNNRCFSNDLVVVITKPKTDADYVYKVDRSTIKEVDDCSVTNISLEEPVVTISGGADTVPQVEPGEIGNYWYLVAYNKSVDDKRAEEYIKISAPTPTDAEIQIGEEMGSENGYYRYVDVTYTGYMNSGAKLYLYIDEGFITNNTKKSSYVRSSDTYVIGDSPEIDIVVGDIATISESLPSPVFKSYDYFTSLSYYSEVDYQTLCMSENSYNGLWDTQQVVTIQSPNKINEYVKYYLTTPSGENITYEKSASEDKVVLFLVENGTYIISAEDRFGNGYFDTFYIYRDDCESPYKTKDLTGNEYITNYFDDYLSGVRSVYVFVHPYSPDELISEFDNIRSSFKTNEQSLILNAFGGQYIGIYGDHVSDYKGGYIENATLNDIISYANSKSAYCEQYYIYFLVNDNSMHGNNQLFSINNSYYGSGCSGNIEIPWDPTEPECGPVCQMKINSIDWFDSTIEERAERHQENIEICYNAFGDSCNYDENSGVWYYCDSEICKELYTGEYVSRENAGSPITPPTN